MPLETKTWVGAELAAGRYTVLSELGAGGMAFVYLALDREDNRKVVVKVPRPAMLEDADFAGRFVREGKSLVRLVHPNIVKIFDAGEHAGRPFLIMGFLPGGSLGDRLARGRLPMSDLQTWLAGIASALDFCHANDCVHRDVKPDNILFDAQGQAYLSDFGIAKVMSKSPKTKMTVLTSAGMVLGTAQYMAPELVMGKKYDGKADQYGLAVTVYECLAGQTPYTGNTPMAVIVEQSTKDVPPLQSVNPAVSQKVANLVHRALAKDPAGRFADCTALAQAVLAEIGAAKAPTPESPNVTCPGCGKQFNLPPAAIGKKLRCPACKMIFGERDTRNAPTPARRKNAAAAVNDRPKGTPVIPVADLIPDSDRMAGTPGRPLPKRGRALGLVSLVVAGAAVAACLLIGIVWQMFAPLNGKGKQPETAAGGYDLTGGFRFCHFGPDHAVWALITDNDKKAERWQVSVMDARTGQKIAGPLTHQHLVYHAAFSADGTRVATASYDKTAVVWDARTGQKITGPLTHQDYVYHAAFSADGTRVVTASFDKTAVVWDARTGEKIAGPLTHQDPVLHAAFSADGTRVVTASYDKTAVVWDARTGQKIAGPLTHQDPVLHSAFSADGTRVVTASDDKTAAVWDARTGQKIAGPLTHQGPVQHAAFSADGTRVVTASKDKTAVVWDARTGQKIAGPLAHQHWVNHAAFSADGTRVVTASFDMTAVVWDARTGQKIAGPLTPQHVVWHAVFSADGTRVVTASGKTAVVWDARTGEKLGSATVPE